QIEQRLRKALSQSIVSKTPGGKSSIFDVAYAMVAGAQGADRLVNFNIKIGTTSPASWTSCVPADELAAPQSVEQGQYKAAVAVPVNEDLSVRFYPLAPSIQLCDEHAFQPVASNMTPSTVLIEASFYSDAKQEKQAALHKVSACAAVGG